MAQPSASLRLAPGRALLLAPLVTAVLVALIWAFAAARIGEERAFAARQVERGIAAGDADAERRHRRDEVVAAAVIATATCIAYGALMVRFVARQQHQGTTLRRAAETLRRSEDLMQRIADALPMRVAFVDAEQRYRFNNLAYEKYFGIPREAMAGRTMREVVGDAVYAELEPWVRRALAGETVSFQREPATADGFRSLEVNYIPSFDVDGATVLGFQSVIHDVTATRLEERRLLQLAQTDAVTGVANRTGLQLALARALEEARASGLMLALLVLDIDRFKAVNDRHGHAAGDALLKGFATRLVRALRVSDLVARLGGDEFAILLTNLRGTDEATRIADKLLDAVRRPFPIGNERLEITSSIGIAIDRNGTTTPDALLKLGDESMYRAKKAGRDNWKSADASGRPARSSAPMAGEGLG